MASRARSRAQLTVLPGGAAGDDAGRDPLSDEELIEGVVRGDDRIAAELYDRLIRSVDHTLYRVFGRREPDHDDLVQATFEQIVLTLSKRRYARACSLKTWASTIARNVGLNALRSRRRERAVIDRADDATHGDRAIAPTADPERSADLRAQLDRVRVHMAEMNPRRAEAVFLHDVLGHALAEVAVLTGVSVSAAQSRLVRGRRELFERMDRDSPADDRRKR